MAKTPSRSALSVVSPGPTGSGPRAISANMGSNSGTKSRARIRSSMSAGPAF